MMRRKHNPSASGPGRAAILLAFGWGLAVLTFLAGLAGFPAPFPAAWASAGAPAPLLADCRLEQSPLLQRFRNAWPQTDFSRCSVPLDDILSGGPGKDGIPAIDQPVFQDPASVELPGNEPVIVLRLNGEARAYPLRVLIWHEIVNDQIGDIPVSVTYCPLCNSSIVFDRRHDGKVLDFGTTGNLRHSDLVMYDRQSETWWQQYNGQGLFGRRAGEKLRIFPSSLEDFASFRREHPQGKVLVPTNPELRPYGSNPYVGYDSPGGIPFLYRGEVPEGVQPMERVIVAEDQAWALSWLRQQGEIRTKNLILRWRPGQASALDRREIAQGRDTGTVRVFRAQPGTDAAGEPVPYLVTFAFVWHSFNPEIPVLRNCGRPRPGAGSP